MTSHDYKPFMGMFLKNRDVNMNIADILGGSSQVLDTWLITMVHG